MFRCPKHANTYKSDQEPTNVNCANLLLALVAIELVTKLRNYYRKNVFNTYVWSVYDAVINKLIYNSK